MSLATRKQLYQLAKKCADDWPELEKAGETLAAEEAKGSWMLLMRTALIGTDEECASTLALLGKSGLLPS